MSEDYLAQQQPTLIWNSARGVWEKAGMANLLCEHWELFSETWPTSGMMRNGQVFELPMQAHRTTASESLSLPTLPTTRAQHGDNRNNKIYARDPKQPQNLENALAVLPTPTTTDWKGPNNSGGPSTSANGLTTKISKLEINWGKFEPAIRRWEETLGRPAPAPTKPDGKDGAHRLSSAFTEWMMGVPEGWITGIGLSRNDELKACGNGVVPQQAELALRILLQGIAVQSKRGGGQTVLPTPTVMDQRDGKHFRTVALKNLAEGANRGLNLNNIVEAGLTDWHEGDQFEIVAGKAVKKQVAGD